MEEEKYTIKLERKISKELGEPRRYNHRGEYLNAKSVFECENLNDEEYILVRKLYIENGGENRGTAMFK